MPNSEQQSTAAGEIPEELIMTDILPKISESACVGRCRCVCKSWRDRLSAPSLIRHHKLLSTDSSSSAADYQIMIIGSDDKRRDTYSLHSAETLRPPNPTMLLPSTGLQHGFQHIKVVRCCDGLFCLLAADHEASTTGLILWNPATSETKVVPPPPSHHRDHDRYVLPVGFGFDSETNDYKVFRQLGHGCFVNRNDLVEVYSLRKDSWRILDGSYPSLPSCLIPTFHKGRLYWWERTRKSLRFDSFDIGSEAFERVYVPCPVADVVDCLHGCWFSEESMVTQFLSDDWRNVTFWEIWMLLKCWESESWIKLFVITTPVPMYRMEFTGLARNLTSFFKKKHRDGHESIIVFDPETGGYNEFEIDGQKSFQAITYMSSQVCFRG